MINKAWKLSTKFRQMVNRFFPKHTLKEAINQKHCYLCGQTIFNSLPICNGCRIDLPWNNNACDVCAIPMPQLINKPVIPSSTLRICGECLNHKPSFNRCISAFYYAFPINTMISDFKYNARRHLGKLMAMLLAQRIEQQTERQALKMPDMLIPVPLHMSRFDARGFNQSQDLCIDLSKYLKIPIDAQSIERTVNTSSQASLSKKKRQHNLANSFDIKKSFDGKIVALVDDVVTTGATVELLSSLLLLSLIHI